ncbi:Lrp/AsnC family transcriptional regulator [Saccharopolyspora erythraea]|uniref:Lrp/AsnC family transcriptional regulator n=1 Tax=Saccharopolyspora erythraea TaxID=1836 RepID=UPI001BA73B79|nr:Lrp/AsnC family transcriptional regulator [Saccharopolyspora erythraea]QUH01990.1 Lrp/AsnC family transcriptional regulator [Saccharopolyspora erythraea]
MNSRIDEQDLALLHALQIAPRVSWAEAARVLGTTATTLATRWERLRSGGLAWVTAHPGRQLHSVTVAFVDIDVVPAEREAVIGWLVRDPRAVTVEEVASGRDLTVTAMVAGHDELSRFVLDDLPAVPGVTRVRMRVATGIHFEASRWRLDAIDREQQAALPAPRAGAAAAPLPAAYWPLAEALAYDGRRSAADLARITGRKPATVRRQVARLLASDLLSFRCEIAQVRSRWPLACAWFGRVPPQEADRTVRSLTTLPELRLCASLAGDTNFMFVVWAHSTTDMVRLERLLADKLPWLDLTESMIMLRTRKRMGWLLGEDGRATGEVVVPSPALSLRGD